MCTNALPSRQHTWPHDNIPHSDDRAATAATARTHNIGLHGPLSPALCKASPWWVGAWQAQYRTIFHHTLGYLGKVILPIFCFYSSLMLPHGKSRKMELISLNVAALLAPDKVRNRAGAMVGHSPAVSFF